MIIYYHQGGSWNLGEHIILGGKKGKTQKIFLLKGGGQKIFIKRIF